MTRWALSLMLAELIGLPVNCSITSKICGQPPPKIRPNPTETEHLVGELGSPDETRRSAAAARLEAMPEAVDALGRAVNSGNTSLESHAKPVLRECLLRKNRRMASGYPIDLLAERLVCASDEYDVESYWRVTAEGIGKILDSEERTRDVKRWVGPGMEKFPAYDFTKYLGHFGNGKRAQSSILIDPADPIPEGRPVYVLRRTSLDLRAPTMFAHSLLVSCGTVQTAGQIHNSAVIAGGDVMVRDFGGVIVAGGDVKARKIGGLVIAKGSVTCTAELDRAFVVSGGRIDCPRSRESTLRPNVPKLLGWVRFFEVSDAGLEIAAVDGGVKVTKIADRQPPQVAGLRVGDVITAIDGSDFKDVTQFRRLLRHSTVQKSSKFTVQRDGKAIDIKACYVGWEPPSSKPE